MATIDLQGQVAVISGGLGDIGRAIAVGMAKSGADVAIGDLADGERAAGLLAELEALGVRAMYSQADVSDAAAVAAWIAAVGQSLGTPTIVVPNAARVTISTCLSMSPEQWRGEMAANLDGAFYMAQAAAKRLVAEGLSGRMVFVGSWAGHAPHPKIPAYSASKAGLRMLMQCLALELAPHGILVNEVAPGYVDAGLSGRIFDEQPGLREAAQAKVPIRRLISAADVAYEVLHLCDPDNRHMTGSVLLMEGGLSLCGPAT